MGRVKPSTLWWPRTRDPRSSWDPHSIHRRCLQQKQDTHQMSSDRIDPIQFQHFLGKSFRYWIWMNLIYLTYLTYVFDLFELFDLLESIRYYWFYQFFELQRSDNGMSGRASHLSWSWCEAENQRSVRSGMAAHSRREDNNREITRDIITGLMWKSTWETVL